MAVYEAEVAFITSILGSMQKRPVPLKTVRDVM